jgi:hypothetical protein
MGGVALSVEEAVDTGEARRALGEGDEGAVHSDAPPPPSARRRRRRRRTRRSPSHLPNRIGNVRLRLLGRHPP